MKIISVKAKNFASYRELNFKFDAQGLCFISGPTGSGKSTLCDLVPWCIFGVSSKNGAADEVIPFNADGPTVVTVTICLPTKQIGITRQRKPNDLYIDIINTEGNSITVQSRGKDLNDTQRQINALLGMDAETYLAGAYFHEFSKTAQFFNTSAKNRRLICEQIVDLSLAKSIQDKASEAKKQAKEAVSKLEHSLNATQKMIDYRSELLESFKEKSVNFEADKEAELIRLAEAHVKYEETKKRDILNLAKQMWDTTEKDNLLQYKKGKLSTTQCPTCGNHLDEDLRKEVLSLEKDLQHAIRENADKKKRIQKLMNEPNPFDSQIEAAERRQNTYDFDIARVTKLIENDKIALGTLNQELQNATQRLSDLDLLSEVVDTYRATQITSTIDYIQDKTNSFLSDYFNAEIKTAFDVKAADKLEVTIYKDDNECSYTQLSKGQRQVLKLTFGIAVMYAVSNKSGIQFNSIFLDESLDGMSDELKLKSYRLFSSLALDYSSVFFIDHSSELKALAEKTFKISINNGESSIEEI